MATASKRSVAQRDAIRELITTSLQFAGRDVAQADAILGLVMLRIDVGRDAKSAGEYGRIASIICDELAA